jgi:hypothetical protein
MDVEKFILFDIFSATQNVADFLLIPQSKLLMTIGPEISPKASLETTFDGILRTQPRHLPK